MTLYHDRFICYSDYYFSPAASPTFCIVTSFLLPIDVCDIKNTGLRSKFCFALGNLSSESFFRVSLLQTTSEHSHLFVQLQSECWVVRKCGSFVKKPLKKVKKSVNIFVREI